MNRERVTIKSMSEKGFTLIEIIVVISIIALLVSAVGFQLGRTKKQANRNATTMSLASIDQALERFKMDFNVYPTLTTDGALNDPAQWVEISKALCAQGAIAGKAFQPELMRVLSNIGNTEDEQTIDNKYNGPYLKASKGIKKDGYGQDFKLIVDNTTGTYKLSSEGETTDAADDIISDGSQLDITP